MGVPTNGWFIISINGKSTKMDDLGVPLFQKTPISSHQCGHQEWWPAVAGQALQLAVFAWFEATPWNGHNLQPQKWSQNVHATIYTKYLHIQSYTPYWIIQIEHNWCFMLPQRRCSFMDSFPPTHGRGAREAANHRDVDGGTCAARACVPRYRWGLAASENSEFSGPGKWDVLPICSMHGKFTYIG